MVCTHFACVSADRCFGNRWHTRCGIYCISFVLPVWNVDVGGGNDLQEQKASALVAHPFALLHFGGVVLALYAPARRQPFLGRLCSFDARIAHGYLLDSFRTGTYLLGALAACCGRGLMQRKALRMKTWLNLFTVFLLLCTLTVSIQADLGEPFVLSQTYEDALGGVFFFGESTTAHLARTGGILDSDAHRGQVWRDESGTRCLDMRILSSPVFYYGKDKTEKLSFADAVERVQPRVLVLSFGLNGISRWSRDRDAFLRTYRALIDGIRERSPHTHILLQSVYPVGENSCFSLPVVELNDRICHLNTLISQLAKEYENASYVHTASLLSDADGTLLRAYDSGDGIHLTNEAYQVVLTHLCQRLAEIE